MKLRHGFVSNSSASSFVIIGIPIDRRLLWETKPERQCQCEVDLSGGTPKFCPKCGTEFMGEEEVETGGYDSNKGEFHGMKVSTQYHYDTEEFFLVAAEGSASQDEFGTLDLPDIAAAKDKARNILEPLGRWDADRFKLYYGCSGG